MGEQTLFEKCVPKYDTATNILHDDIPPSIELHAHTVSELRSTHEVGKNWEILPFWTKHNILEGMVKAFVEMDLQSRKLPMINN